MGEEMKARTFRANPEADICVANLMQRIPLLCPNISATIRFSLSFTDRCTANAPIMQEVIKQVPELLCQFFVRHVPPPQRVMEFGEREESA